MSRIPTDQLPREIPAKGPVIRTPVLLGEIPGVDTFHVRIPPGECWRAEPERGKIRVLFFLEGEGDIASEHFLGRFRNPALFAPPAGKSFEVKASARGCAALEILMAIENAEAAELVARGNPATFVSYADCTTYREAIKSEKTVSRTIVPENRLPRFCMGSVETTGPDLVAAHKHPMLEQLFFGLPGNKCFVKADDDETLLGDNVLLHIPLGSNHSVRVEPGDKLHYLWLDFFRNQEGMKWITEMHKTEDR